MQLSLLFKDTLTYKQNVSNNDRCPFIRGTLNSILIKWFTKWFPKIEVSSHRMCGKRHGATNQIKWKYLHIWCIFYAYLMKIFENIWCSILYTWDVFFLSQIYIFYLMKELVAFYIQIDKTITKQDILISKACEMELSRTCS